MFGAFQPNPNPMQPSAFSLNPPQPPQPATINIGDQQVHAFYGEQFKQLIDGYHQLEWDQNLQNLLFLLKLEQERSMEIMEKAKSTDFTRRGWDAQNNKEKLEYVRDRCSRIKKRNLGLLIKMMNLR
jgi:hypothetical protein